MVAVGNVCLGLASLEFLVLLMILNAGPQRVTGTLAPVFWWLILAILLTYSTLFCVVVASGRLGASTLLRAALYPGALVSCLCLVIFTGFTIWCEEIRPEGVPAAIRFFGFHASWIVPGLMLLLSFLLLHHDLVPRIPLSLLRAFLFALGIVGIGVCLSILSEWAAFDKWNAQERAASQKAGAIEYERAALEKVQQADSTTGFAQLLEYTTDLQSSPAIHQLATQKLLSSGPRLGPLLTTQLQTGDFERALQFLRDNDLPDPAPLAEPARAAMLRVAAKVRKPEVMLFATDFERLTDVILMVADKYQAYGIDYVPAVREFRAALDAPETSKNYLPASCLKSVDAWLVARKGK